jgi:hypothetical protein
MNRAGHELLAVTLALALLPTGRPVEAIIVGGIGVMTAGGRLSPDVDQYVDRIPHRGPTHTVEYVAAALALAWILLAPIGGWPVATGLTLGWGSHLLGDWMFGRTGIPTILFARSRHTLLRARKDEESRRFAHRRQAGRLALRMPWGERLHSGGVAERYIAYPLMILICLVMLWMRGLALIGVSM